MAPGDRVHRSVARDHFPLRAPLERPAGSGAAVPSAHSDVFASRTPGCDDVTLYVLLLVVGLVAIVAQLLSGGPWGVQPTLGALLVVGAASGLIFRRPFA